MKRFLVSLVLALASTVACAQWQPQEITATSNLSPLSTTPDGSCADFSPAEVVACVYWAQTASGITNIMEVDSTDGGVSWGAPYQITFDTGQDYNPYISYDWYHQQFLVVYSKWHNNQGGTGNDLMIMAKNTPWTHTWGAPLMVVGGDGHSYWEGSAYSLQDGVIMVAYAKDGPESGAGPYSGSIWIADSINNLASFNGGVPVSNLCNAEFPRVTQSGYNGVVVLVYSRYVDTSHLPIADTACSDFVANGYPQSDIHMIESGNDGGNWTADVTLYHNPNNSSSLHPSIGQESYGNPAACPYCKWDISFVSGNGDGTNGLYVINSTNAWASWTFGGRYPGSMSFANNLNINPTMTMTCTGFMLTYTDAYPGQNMYNLRYVANSACIAG